MKRKRKVLYQVTTFAGLFWCGLSKQWFEAGEECQRKNALFHVHSSHKDCYTINSALKSCRQLANILSKDEEIIIVRISWKHGRRKITEFNFNR